RLPRSPFSPATYALFETTAAILSCSVRLEKIEEMCVLTPMPRTAPSIPRNAIEPIGMFGMRKRVARWDVRLAKDSCARDARIDECSASFADERAARPSADDILSAALTTFSIARICFSVAVTIADAKVAAPRI